MKIRQISLNSTRILEASCPVSKIKISERRICWVFKASKFCDEIYPIVIDAEISYRNVFYMAMG